MKLLSPLLMAVVIFSAACSTQARELTGDERALHVLNRLGYGP